MPPPPPDHHPFFAKVEDACKASDTSEKTLLQVGHAFTLARGNQGLSEADRAVMERAAQIVHDTITAQQGRGMTRAFVNRVFETM